MLQVKSNAPFRNVHSDALKSIDLLKHSVFFGVNGAGKSTVCEVLQEHTVYQNPTGIPPVVYAFTEKWRETNVGDFVKGGSAREVTTVNLAENAGAIEDSIRSKEQLLKQTLKDVEAEVKNVTNIKNELSKIKDAVFNGERKTLESKCDELTSRRFNRSKIEKALGRGNLTLLSDKELEEFLTIAAASPPEMPPLLPPEPRRWSYSDEVWSEVKNGLPALEKAVETITAWARKGLERHKAGDSCEFCAGEVTQARLDEVKNAIDFADQGISEQTSTALAECRECLTSLEEYKTLISHLSLSSDTYDNDLANRKTQFLLAIEQLLKNLRTAETQLAMRIDAPWDEFDFKKPNTSFSDFDKKLEALETELELLRGKVSDHSANKHNAITKLQEHCCAKDGATWEATKTRLSAAEKSLDLERSKVTKLERELNELKSSISTTARTAEFLDNNLSLILGDRVLRVKQGSNPGEGYVITRDGDPATDMSEGEKKLVSLLYFCAEFETEERKSSMRNSIILLDDLGSELDDTRLLATDRFVSDHFSKLNPAALVYFTHSHSYLRILQNRLASKATKRTGATAQFFEVYKHSYDNNDRTTRVRKWDSEAVNLINDYWLSFYLVTKEFSALIDGTPPSLASGNYCRKTLEGFTEFKSPVDSKFGTAINSLLAKHSAEVSPSLSKVVNELSHSGVARTGGALSRNELEQAVVQTLSFMRAIDSDHFTQLLQRVRGKEAAKEITQSLDRINRI